MTTTEAPAFTTTTFSELAPGDSTVMFGPGGPKVQKLEAVNTVGRTTYYRHEGDSRVYWEAPADWPVKRVN